MARKGGRETPPHERACSVSFSVVIIGAADAVVVAEQDQDNDKQDPGAVTAVEQITKTHCIVPPFSLGISIVYAGRRKWVTASAVRLL